MCFRAVSNSTEQSKQSFTYYILPLTFPRGLFRAVSNSTKQSEQSFTYYILPLTFPRGLFRAAPTVENSPNRELGQILKQDFSASPDP
jgi:hypothetical protein